MLPYSSRPVKGPHLDLAGPAQCPVTRGARANRASAGPGGEAVTSSAEAAMALEGDVVWLYRCESISHM